MNILSRENIYVLKYKYKHIGIISISYKGHRVFQESTKERC